MPAALHAFATPFADALRFDHARIFSAAMLLPDWPFALAMSLAFVGAIIAIVIVATLAVGGFVFAPRASQFDIGRLSPVRGFTRLFSLAVAFEGLRVAARLALVLGLTLTVLMLSEPPAGALTGSPGAAFAAVFEWVGKNLLVLAAAFSALTLVEIIARYWLHKRAERMTRAEVLQEYRETEGHPEIRAQIEARRRALQSRQMQ